MKGPDSMSSHSKITNPFIGPMQKRLTKRLGLDTLAGGKEGQGQDEASPEAAAAYSADNRSGLDESLVMCLDALLDMLGATRAGDREALDESYETLVTLLEVFRDACPKA